MTIKWVKSDPLVMNGEPFCYGTRLTVRNLLEMRAAGLAPATMIAQNPEPRRVGVATAFAYAAEHRERSATSFDADGAPVRPGSGADHAAALPEDLRGAAGIVLTKGQPAPVPART